MLKLTSLPRPTVYIGVLGIVFSALVASRAEQVFVEVGESKVFDFNSARVVYKSPTPLLEGMNLDVFWCNGDNQAPYRALTAAEFAGSYSALTRELKLPIAEIRTRPIDRNTALLAAGQLGRAQLEMGPFARVYAGDPQSLVTFEALTAGGDQKVRTIYEGQTPNYASIYLCSGGTTTDLYGRLFVQVKEKDQIEAAKTAINSIRLQWNNVAVAPGVEITGDKSPNSSELRYFRPDDKFLAESLAGDISRTLSSDVQPKFVEGFDAKVKPGTVEAWIVDK